MISQVTIDSRQDLRTYKDLTMSEHEPEWIFASDAAEIMGVSVSNVYYLCRNKKITCRKWGNTWQVSKQDAESYERSKRNPTWLHPDDDDNEG